MDAESEKLCLQELDHVILDLDKKVKIHFSYESYLNCIISYFAIIPSYFQVTLTYISNNWSTLSKNAENVLKKWVEKYTGDKSIAKEYLIRGTDANGNSIITVNIQTNDEIS